MCEQLSAGLQTVGIAQVGIEDAETYFNAAIEGKL